MVPASSVMLERLGDELSRRGLRTTLAPQSDEQLALDVHRIEGWVRCTRRITWSGGCFTWPWGEQIAADVATAALKISDVMGWHFFLARIGMLPG